MTLKSGAVRKNSPGGHVCMPQNATLTTPLIFLYAKSSLSHFRPIITGITEAHARGARGHVDCMEIVQGQGHAGAIPIVQVFHLEAKVTHEAAIGNVDKKELETLMARGLAPEQAVELIVSGILR